MGRHAYYDLRWRTGRRDDHRRRKRRKSVAMCDRDRDRDRDRDKDKESEGDIQVLYIVGLLLQQE